MKIIRLIKLVSLIFIIQLLACRPKPHIGPHTTVVLEIDTAGFYKQPGKSNLANIRFLAKKAAEVIRQRLESMNVDEDFFELSDTNNLITLKIWQPKISIKHIAEILQAGGNLGFWRTHDAKHVYAALYQPGHALEPDSLQSLQNQLSELLKINSSLTNNPSNPGKIAALGFARSNDTARINAILKKFDLLGDTHFLWGIKKDETNDFLNLYIAQGNKPVLLNPVLTDVKTRTGGNMYGSYAINFTMDEASAQIWERLTKQSHELFIAITIDNKVYSCPIVKNTIPNGVCSISGGFTKEQANDIAAILSSGPMPAPIRIVEENIEN